MAIKRYWRLIGANTSGGTALDLSECRLYEGGVIADAGATLTCTIAPTSGALADLRDGVATSVVSWPVASYSAPGWALSWDFGVGGSVDAPKLRLGSGTTQANWLLDAALQYCTDGVTWVTFGVVAGISYPGASALTTAPDANAPDAYATSDSLLLLGNGTNGSTSIIDSSVTSPKTVTAVGNAQISTAQSKFGGSALLLDGSGDYVSTPGNVADFNFGSGDFTVECWIYQRTRTAGEYDSLLRMGNASGFGISFAIYIGAAYLGFLVANTASTGWAASGTASVAALPALNTWAHLAFVRSGSTFTLYKDGVSVCSATYAGAVKAPTTPLEIGWSGTADSYFDGYIDDFRITKGVARYTSGFTPPTTEAGSATVVVAATSAYTARATRLAPVPERLLPAVELPNTTASTHSREYTHCDIYFGGDGSITGTVKEKHSPANTPLYRRVLLIDERSQQVIRETWSDAITGNFAFNGIKIGPAYSTLSLDHLHNYRAVVADNLSA